MRTLRRTTLATLIALLVSTGMAEAGPLDISSEVDYVERTYIPTTQGRLPAAQPEAAAMLTAGAAGTQKPFYGGANASEIGLALIKDLGIITRDPTEFLAAVEFSVIGLCYKLQFIPVPPFVIVKFAPYYGYYWPTTTNEMADTYQSEYIPEQILSLLRGTIGIEELLYPHVQGDEAGISALGLDAPTAVARAGRVATRNPEFEKPEKADVVDLVKSLDPELRLHSGSDGLMNHKEWRAMPNLLQILYAEGGGFGLMDHKRDYARKTPIIFSELSILQDLTRVAEASNYLFPEVMGAMESLSGVGGGALNQQVGLKGNPARCIGHNIVKGNTPSVEFFSLLGRINQGIAYSVPHSNSDLCTENIGSDYPVTTFSDTPVSGMPFLSFIRSNNLLGHRDLEFLTGGVRQGFFDYKKYQRDGWRADKLQFRDSNKDGFARFLINRQRNSIWQGSMGDRESWVASANNSPESFLSTKHRPGVDLKDPGRSVLYQWSGFRQCKRGYKPLLLFGITDEKKKPELRGYEKWPGGGGGRI